MDRAERPARPRGRHSHDGARPRPVLADACLVPPGRAAARARGKRNRRAPRRRRDRPPAPGPAHSRLLEARGRSPCGRRLRDARRPAPVCRRLPGRGERDGDREHRHGYGDHARNERDRQRRVRAARPGSLPVPRLARRPDRGNRVQRPARRGSRLTRWRRVDDRPRSRRGCELHRARGGHRRGRDSGRREGGRSEVDPPDLRQARRARRARGRHGARPAGAGALCRGRHRRAHSEDRGRSLAGVPVRLHVDRAHGRDAGSGDGAAVREDVREPPVLHGQARLDGCSDHPLRPTPRRRHGADEASRPADGEPGHPRRNVDAPREPVRRGRVDDRRRLPDRQGLRADRRAPARSSVLASRECRPSGRRPA